MPWCPKCKSEYRAGFTTCADCGSTLVEDLKDVKESLWEDSAPEGFFGEPEGESFSQDELDEIAETTKSLAQNSGSKKDDKLKRKESSDKANDNRSSGWTLVILGIVGIIVTILCALKIIPINVGSPALVYSVVGGMFVIFFIGGIVSFKNVKFYEKRAEEEDVLKETILNWCKDNIDPKKVDIVMNLEGEPAEAVYLKRFICLRGLVAQQFPNQDDNFVDNLLEDCVYDAVFGEDQ